MKKEKQDEDNKLSAEIARLREELEGIRAMANEKIFCDYCDSHKVNVSNIVHVQLLGGKEVFLCEDCIQKIVDAIPVEKSVESEKKLDPKHEIAYSFHVTKDQSKKLKKWRKKVGWEAAQLRPNPADLHLIPAGEKYDGGSYTYIFSPTGIGDGLTVKEEITGKEINLTDYSNW